MASKSQAQKLHVAHAAQLIGVSDLSGGLDLRRSPTLVAQNRARVLRNYSLSQAGALAVRPGFLRYSTNSLGAARIQGGVRAYLASTQITLIAWDGGVYEVRDVSPAGQVNTTAVFSTISSTNQVYFPFDRQLVAVTDAANRPRKSTDGVAWTRMGIDVRTSSSVPSSIGGGSLSASEFEVTYAYKDRGLAHQSNICTNVSTLTLGATGALAITVPNSSDAQVDAIVLYARNKTAGETVLRSVSSGAMQGAASSGVNSTFSITSSNWSANAEAPTNHNVPPAIEWAVVWKNRWWGKSSTVGNRLHFTELFQNQSWPTLFFIDIPFEFGDEITAAVPLGDTLVLFGESGAFLIIGQTSLDFEVRPSPSVKAGALGQRAVDTIEHGVLHVASDGAYVFDGATDKLLTYDIEPGFKDLAGNSADVALSQVAVVSHDREKEVRIAVPRLFPRGVRGEWVLNLNRTHEQETAAWSDTDRDIIGYVHFHGAEPTAGNRLRLFSWGSSGGYLMEESTGTSGNSSNITAEYESAHLTFGLHRARVVRTFLEYEPNAGAFSADVIIDGINDGSQTIAIGSGLAVYGTALYGTDFYVGAGRRAVPLTHRLSAEGRSVWLTSTYIGQNAFRWFTYGHEIVPDSHVAGFTE